jgi:hypothetical protein
MLVSEDFAELVPSQPKGEEMAYFAEQTNKMQHRLVDELYPSHFVITGPGQPVGERFVRISSFSGDEFP